MLIPHAKKFVALAQNNPGQLNPVLLKMDYDSGHGSGKSTAQQVEPRNLAQIHPCRDRRIENGGCSPNRERTTDHSIPSLAGCRTRGLFRRPGCGAGIFRHPPPG